MDTSDRRRISGFAFLDINASQIPGSGDEGRPLFAEFGRTTPTREWDGRTHSIYHALQATLNRRFSDGLLLKGAYTWSKAIDEAPYSDWTEFRYNALSVFDRNRALADHDIPHNFQLAVVYELPFGAGEEVGDDGYQQRDPGRLAVERRLRRLLGPTVQSDGVGRVAEHAGQPADARTRSRTTSKILGNVGDDGTYFDTTRVRAGHRGPVRQRGPQHACVDPAW